MADGLAGFLDDPLTQLSLGLLGGQSPHFGQNLMQALMYQKQMQEQADKRKLAQMQLESSGLDLAQKKQGVADADAFRGAMSGAPNFASPMLPSMAPTVDNAKALQQAKTGPYEQAAKMVEYLRSKRVSEQYIKPYVDQMEKMRPKFKADQQLIKMPDGSLGLLNMADDGTPQVVPYAPAEKQHASDTGGVTQLWGEYSGKPGGAMENTVSPNSLFTGNVTMRGQNMTDARARDLNAITREASQTQILETPNGPIAVNKGSATSRPVTSASGQPIAGDAQQKREMGAKNVLSLLNEAEKILPNSTNSYIGAGADVAYQAIGGATEGAKGTASLKAIEGALLSQMPRMEGPQSNYDVAMYKQAAGQLGDPTIPREIKKAAIDTIRSIQSKYAGNGGWSIKPLQ